MRVSNHLLHPIIPLIPHNDEPRAPNPPPPHKSPHAKPLSHVYANSMKPSPIYPADHAAQRLSRPIIQRISNLPCFRWRGVVTCLTGELGPMVCVVEVVLLVGVVGCGYIYRGTCAAGFCSFFLLSLHRFVDLSLLYYTNIEPPWLLWISSKGMASCMCCRRGNYSSRWLPHLHR